MTQPRYSYGTGQATEQREHSNSSTAGPSTQPTQTEWTLLARVLRSCTPTLGSIRRPRNCSATRTRLTIAIDAVREGLFVGDSAPAVFSQDYSGFRRLGRVCDHSGRPEDS